jgi:hypothetical protein
VLVVCFYQSQARGMQNHFVWLLAWMLEPGSLDAKYVAQPGSGKRQWWPLLHSQAHRIQAVNQLMMLLVYD